MFINDNSLPHLLEPSSYCSGEQFERERSTVLATGWHLVGTTSDLARPGDFLAFELFGTPLQVRNFGDQLRALSNVCAHRHCLMTSQPQGNSPRLSCQYHGWEYGEDGKTRHIPQPKNFTPLDRETHRLPVYRVETCGKLVFVSLAEEGPDLREQLGDLFDTVAERFGDEWEPFLSWEPTFDANWKIPVENSLEAYHVPNIHSATFGKDPGELRSEHILDERHTAFGTSLPFNPHSRLDAWFQRGEGWMTRRLGCQPEGRYWQHHVFPNLLFSFTDAISLCNCVIPTGPTTSRAVVRQFGRVGKSHGLWRGVAKCCGKIEAFITKRILVEDQRLFGDIQRGMQASTQPGVLGRCEERIYVFQDYVQRAVSHMQNAESKHD